MVTMAGVLIRTREGGLALEEWIALAGRKVNPADVGAKTCSKYTPDDTELVDRSDEVFADDTITFCIFLHLTHVAQVIAIWHDLLLRFRLVVNFEKTKIMIFNKGI